MDENNVYGHLGIIAMTGCEDIGEAINNYLKEWRYSDEGFLIKHSCPRFLSGEAKGVIEQTVRGYDVFIICDCFNYNISYNLAGREVFMSPDDHFADLKRIISALGGKARRIHVILPMLYEGRQHKRSGLRESLDCATALQELVAMGVKNILTFDAHDPRVQNAIPLSGFDTVAPYYQMIKALCREVPDIEFSLDKALIVSPDEGGMARCMYYSSMLGLDLGMFYKRRDYSKIVDGRNPIIALEFLGNEVRGKDAVIVDDIIATGESIVNICRVLKEKGARRIFAFITFGLFSGGMEKFDEAYNEGLIDKIFTSNMVYRPEELAGKKWYAEVNMSKYIAVLIDALNHDDSISGLLNPTAKISALLHSRNKK